LNVIASLLCSALLAQVPTPSPAPVVGQQTAQDIWDKRCTFCHGADGQGHTKKGKQYKVPNFTRDRWQKHTTDEEIISAVTDGVPKTKMLAFKDKLSADEIKSMVPFLRAFAKK
jgi:mono/diheme cytochrome c family protein